MSLSSRPRPPAALALLAANVLVLSSALARLGVSSLEAAVFHALHDLPGPLGALLLVVTPLGSGLAAVVAPGVALAVDRRLAVRLALAAPGAWVVANLLKVAVARGRPADLLADVAAAVGAGGSGFPSGHTAVAVALAATLWPAFGRPRPPGGRASRPSSARMRSGLACGM
jgi:membrane-associated phospholipid phosphatase